MVTMHETGIVSRVAMGKLVYVDCGRGEFAIRLDQILIRDREGNPRNYRGEPLAELGLIAGREIAVKYTNPDGTPTLIVDEQSVPTHPTLSLIGGTISNVTIAISSTLLNLRQKS
jgi:hypothetical protein